MMVLLGTIIILVCMKSGNEKIYRLDQRFWRTRLGRWIRMRDVSILYLILFAVLISSTIIWNVKNIYFGTFEIDDNSARYLLSALVQSQAAIIAIVVTMTLVAVQLTASAYSPRVIDIFKKDWVMWLLLVWYGSSIFFGLFVLEMIGGKYQSLGHWGVSFESCVFLAYLMGIAAFAGLFFHISNVIDLLKPGDIIEKLSKNITREKVSKFIESEEKQIADRAEPAKDDPVQPIMDIIHGAVMKYDIETARVGLKVVKDRVIEIIDSDSQNKTDVEATAKAITKVVRSLELVGNSAIERKLEDVTKQVARSVEDVGRAAIKRTVARENFVDVDFIDVVKQVVRSLDSVGVAAAEKKLGGATTTIVESLGFVGISVADEQLGDVKKTILNQITKSLESVGVAAAKKELRAATVGATHSLKHPSIKNADMYKAAWSIIGVGMAAAEKLPNDVVNEVAECLAELAGSNERIVEKAIENREPALGENDRKFFDKFRNLCKQQPEEPRTQY